MNTILGDEPSWYTSRTSHLHTQKAEHNIGLIDYLSFFEVGNNLSLWKEATFEIVNL